jgi:hypothetical protein
MWYHADLTIAVKCEPSQSAFSPWSIHSVAKIVRSSAQQRLLDLVGVLSVLDTDSDHFVVGEPAANGTSVCVEMFNGEYAPSELIYSLWRRHL